MANMCCVPSPFSPSQPSAALQIMLHMQGRQFSSINQPSWSQSQSTSTVPSSSPSSHAPYANAYGGLSSALTAPHENYKIAETSLWSDPALKEIDEVANSMDLDLQPTNGQDRSIARTTAVLDTNVLLGDLDVLQQFAEDLEKSGEPILIGIPGVVVQELDFQKGDRSRDLGWPARMASTWILKRLRERKVVKGQAYGETLQNSGSWKKRDNDVTNDELIVDYCLYLRDKREDNVVVISRDHNLCNIAESQGIQTINPRDFDKWSSKNLAKSIFGHNYPEHELQHFSAYKETFRPRRVRKALDEELGVQPVPQPSIVDDGMEIDDVDYSAIYEPPPQHLLDDLHDQVLQHFSILLRELLQRVSPSLFSQSPARSGAAASIYASKTTLRPAKDWKTQEILLYICNHRRIPQLASTGDKEMILNGRSRLADFLTRKYDGLGRGRSGQHWSRADWMSCLDTLRAVGRAYEDDAILNSLAQLDPQVVLIFQMPMRPSGIGGF